MKYIYLIIVVLMLTTCALAQAPKKMSYQAVIRNNNGSLVTASIVGIKITILQGSETGNSVYSETQIVTANANGLVSLEIGNGTVVFGTFTGINWANGPYFIKTETDPAGGTSYTIVGISQLLSVPYALFAENVSKDKDQQQLSVSITGDTLYLQNGGFLIVPGISAANPQAILPNLTTDSIKFITSTSAFIGGNIINSGGATVTERGICWSTSPNPTIVNSIKNIGSGIGSFTSNLTGLTPNTTYYVRAYAINKVGTAYGNELSFTTSLSNPNNLNIVYITDTVLLDVMYNQTSYLFPTKLVFSNLTKVNRIIYFDQTNNIEEVEFPLLTNTGSYVYIHNNLGLKKIVAPNLTTIVDYIYVTGNTLLQDLNICNLSSVLCSGQEPYILINGNNSLIDSIPRCFTATLYGTTLTTSQITQFSRNTAIAGGAFTRTCGGFGQAGICWSTSPNPTSSNNVANASGGSPFTANLTGLTPNTTYYVRAFTGSIYGNEVSFTTLP